MGGMVDFGEVFARLANEGRAEETLLLGGMSVRLVRVAGGLDGRCGGFSVEFRDHHLALVAGQCCVVPAEAEHRGTSRGGADIVLFQAEG